MEVGTKAGAAEQPEGTSPLPLEGVRVLEIGGYISAPYATSLLCALGADVVKVERPGDGDDFRRRQNEASVYFKQYNAGKRSLGLDLKAPEGVALVKALIPHFDVVVENLRAGKLATMGLGPDVCLGLRADLVYASVTGFGLSGPLEQRAAYDTIGQSFGGLFSILSDEGSAQLSGTCLADLVTGLSTATGVLAALLGRLKTGTGHRVETSIMESVSALTIDAITQYFQNGHQDPTRQSRHPQAQGFCLNTSTGDRLTVHLSSSQKFWRALLEAMDRSDLAEDPRFTTYAAREQHYFELVDILQIEFQRRSSGYWDRRLAEADVPFAPVLGVAGYLEHPQTKTLEIAQSPSEMVWR